MKNYFNKKRVENVLSNEQTNHLLTLFQTILLALEALAVPIEIASCLLACCLVARRVIELGMKERRRKRAKLSY
jgi:hypothetical protein